MPDQRRPGLLVRLRTLAEAGQSRSQAVRTLRAEGFRFGSDRIRAFYNIYRGRELSSRQNRAIGLPIGGQIRRAVGRSAGEFSRGARLQSFRIRYRARLNYNVSDINRRRALLRNPSTTVVNDLIIPIDSDRLLRIRDLINEDLRMRGTQVVEADVREKVSGDVIGSPTVVINITRREVRIMGDARIR